ncbi:MAG: hypothetical protein LUI06_09960 [Ruminococcus sp.]|nr:hypothetical protein [Ruminococcus sp.]
MTDEQKNFLLELGINASLDEVSLIEILQEYVQMHCINENDMLTEKGEKCVDILTFLGRD